MTEKEKSISKLINSDSPHIRDCQSIGKIMWFVVLALLPSNVYTIYLSGISYLILLAVSVFSAAIIEFLYQAIIYKKVSIPDGSAVITGLLIAMNVPHGLPVWMTAIASFFAIIIVKQAFGGLGFNIFNPALAAIALLIALWPAEMAVNQEIGIIPLILLLIGAVFLMINKIISWHIPASYLGSFFIIVILYNIISGNEISLRIITIHFFSAGLFLGAFFMATDMVTSPVTKKGMLIFGIGCGIFTFVIRTVGAFEEGVCFAILFMNAAVPLIDKYSKPRVFGAII
ncbi:MAG: RnfABCDGE type electron transport complex subunit D [Spirochaetota bacterium]